MLLSISYDSCLECDVRLEFGNNVSSSLLLVPSDEGVLESGGQMREAISDCMYRQTRLAVAHEQQNGNLRRKEESSQKKPPTPERGQTA